jgi:hypothetical protein
MLITYAGRKSDKEYTTPVSYVRHDGELFVVARARSQISGDGIMGIFASRMTQVAQGATPSGGYRGPDERPDDPRVDSVGVHWQARKESKRRSR